MALYQRLDATHSTIRLLKILPTDDEDGAPIQCTLQEMDLDGDLTYIALSYTWGSAALLRSIWIDGSETMVTENLESALRHLRPAHIGTNIWIDALCINQADISEKEAQVGRMDRIYTRAKMCIAWLGPSCGGSTMAIRALRTTGEAAIRHGILQASFLARSSDTNEFSRVRQNLITMADEIRWTYPFKAVRTFCKRPYWSRLWVLQEFTLPKTLIIQSGTDIIHSDVFAAGIQFLPVLQQRLIATLTDDDMTLPMNHVDDFELETDDQGKVLSRMLHLLKCSPTLHPFVLVGSRRRHQTWATNAPLTAAPLNRLFSFLQDVCVTYEPGDPRFDASEPRDIVYGLLGVVGNTTFTDLGFMVDYTITCEELFARCARAMLERALIRLLSFAGMKDNIHMPTWAPDWRRNPILPRIEDEMFRPYGNLAIEAPIFSEPTTMSLRCVLFDTILSVTEPISISDSSNAGNIEDILQRFRNYVNEHKPPDIPGMTSTRWHEEAYWRTPILDRYASGMPGSRERALASGLEGWQSLMQDHSRPANSGREPFDLNSNKERYATALRQLNGLSMVGTARGTLGVASMFAQRGDSVVIVPGLGALLLTRPGTDTIQSYWQIVGEAYLYGIMDGEAITQQTSMQSLDVR